MARNSVADMVMKGSDVEDVAGGTEGVVEVLSGIGIVVGAVGAGGGIVDMATGINSAGVRGRDSVECSSCDTSSACSGSTTGTE